MISRTTRRIGVALVGSAVLTACTSEHPDQRTPKPRGGSTSTSTVASPSRATPAVIPARSTYVALGSSFAAGAGVPREEPTCGRSDHSYPYLVARRLQLRLVDVACGGATTANVLTAPQGDAPPQIDAVTADTALVTMTVGGNDIAYTATTFQCSAGDDCMVNLDRKQIDAAVAALPGRLEAVVAAVRARAPRAKIALVTYPQVVPATAPCKALGLLPDEARYIHAMGQRLENVFVVVAKRTGIILVDAYASSVDHGVCAASGPRWVAGNQPTEGVAFHPTAAGHAAMADLVVAAVQQ